jgi:trk system potassium uptake protein TrkH
VKLGSRVVPEHVLRDVQVFMQFYLLTFVVTASVVVALGADLVTAISASAECLGNVGPGFNVVGPMASFGPPPAASKIALTLAMWIGRLEVLTVLVLLRFEAWRAARWAADALPARTGERI